MMLSTSLSAVEKVWVGVFGGLAVAFLVGGWLG